jgi:hypothetical protein
MLHRIPEDDGHVNNKSFLLQSPLTKSLFAGRFTTFFAPSLHHTSIHPWGGNVIHPNAYALAAAREIERKPRQATILQFGTVDLPSIPLEALAVLIEKAIAELSHKAPRSVQIVGHPRDLSNILQDPSPQKDHLVCMPGIVGDDQAILLQRLIEKTKNRGLKNYEQQLFFLLGKRPPQSLEKMVHVILLNGIPPLPSRTVVYRATSHGWPGYEIGREKPREG